MQIIEKIEKLEESNLSPFNLNKEIFYLLNFSIHQVRDIDNQNYTFFVIISKERERTKIKNDNTIMNDYTYLYFVKVYKDNKFLEIWTVRCNSILLDASTFLMDKIIEKKIIGHTFMRPSKELSLKLPSDYDLEGSLFSLHLLLKLDFSSFNFDLSRRLLDSKIRFGTEE